MDQRVNFRDALRRAIERSEKTADEDSPPGTKPLALVLSAIVDRICTPEDVELVRAAIESLVCKLEGPIVPGWLWKLTQALEALDRTDESPSSRDGDRG